MKQDVIYLGQRSFCSKVVWTHIQTHTLDRLLYLDHCLVGINSSICLQLFVFDAENSTVTESEMDTEVDTDRESVVDRSTFCHIELRVFCFSFFSAEQGGFLPVSISAGFVKQLDVFS